MGRTGIRLEATASLSSHNSRQDDIDAEKWNEFVRQVRELAAPLEEDISLFVYAEERHVVGWSE